MEDSEEGHLYAQQHSRYPNLDIWCLNPGRRLDSTGACEEGNEDSLPEAEEDDELNGNDFQQRFVMSDVIADLDVELNETVHGDGDCAGFDNHDPNVGESRIEGLEAVSIEGLSNDRDNSHGDSNEAVLEDGHPNHLQTLALSL
jgi:hypothetical protein